MRVLTSEQEDIAIEAALTGQSLSSTARSLGFNSEQAFYEYRKRNPDFAKALADAREYSCEVLEDQILSLADDYDSAHHARVKLESIKSVLAYRKPERYGNRIDLNVTQHLDISGSLARMEQQLNASYRDVIPLIANPNDINDLW